MKNWIFLFFATFTLLVSAQNAPKPTPITTVDGNRYEVIVLERGFQRPITLRIDKQDERTWILEESEIRGSNTSKAGSKLRTKLSEINISLANESGILNNATLEEALLLMSQLIAAADRGEVINIVANQSAKPPTAWASPDINNGKLNPLKKERGYSGDKFGNLKQRKMLAKLAEIIIPEIPPTAFDGVTLKDAVPVLSMLINRSNNGQPINLYINQFLRGGRHERGTADEPFKNEHGGAGEPVEPEVDDPFPGPGIPGPGGFGFNPNGGGIPGAGGGGFPGGVPGFGGGGPLDMGSKDLGAFRPERIKVTGFNTTLYNVSAKDFLDEFVTLIQKDLEINLGSPGYSYTVTGLGVCIVEASADNFINGRRVTSFSPGSIRNSSDTDLGKGAFNSKRVRLKNLPAPFYNITALQMLDLVVASSDHPAGLQYFIDEHAVIITVRDAVYRFMDGEISKPTVRLRWVPFAEAGDPNPGQEPKDTVESHANPLESTDPESAPEK